jgi:hypothetical protein
MLSSDHYAARRSKGMTDLRLPFHDRWLAVGSTAATCGVALAGIQAAFMQGDKHTGFLSSLGIASIAITAIGFLALAVGFFMRDRGKPIDSGDTGAAVHDPGLRTRVGYDIEGMVKSRDATIRNQDTAIRVRKGGRLNDKGTDIK